MPSSLTALVDFGQPQQAGNRRLRLAFAAPRKVLVAYQLSEVRAVLDAVQAQADAGAWCLGYLRYEAAAAFDAAFTTHPADGPLAWFAVHDAPVDWPLVAPTSAAVSVQWTGGVERPEFDAALAQLAAGISQGDYYQVNFTGTMNGTLDPVGAAPAQTARALFHALQRAQPGGYAMLLDTGEQQILSVSPELFFDWHDSHLLTRPMKGTAARGATPQQDAMQAQALRDSPKERAENVMIVDLLRNDVSRIATPHSVQVPRLFHTEALPTVWQMTSDVTATTRADCRLADIFQALFPCGSVTGAPKVQAMRAIAQLERQPRGVYCGALGLVQPGGHATFNVPIRTVSVRGTQARCGIGSGITAGSTPAQEWTECRLKQRFVRRASVAFSLLETLCLQDGNLQHGSSHMARMARAAKHFGFVWDEAGVQAVLQQLQVSRPQGSYRVRLLLDPQGHMQAEVFALTATPARVMLHRAQRPILQALDPAESEFVQFKTTHRAHYDAFAPSDPSVFDSLLWNEREEVTECTRGNIAVLLQGQWLTPPLACGLLDGVGRAQALADGRLQEAVIRLADLPAAQGFAFINSLRGWIAADLQT